MLKRIIFMMAILMCAIKPVSAAETMWTIPVPKACDYNGPYEFEMKDTRKEGLVPVFKCADNKGNRIIVIVHKDGWMEITKLKEY